MPHQKPIERTFLISEVNRIAEREAHAKRYYPPSTTCTSGERGGWAACCRACSVLLSHRIGS
jgi:hypothetical protein